ncbi:MAG: hypothetical protein V3V20_00930 [Algisphaera sp.]
MLTPLHITPVYGRGGIVEAWIDDDVVFDMCGRWVAFIDDAAVYNFKGKLLGFFEDGWFRDQKGDAAAFTQDCNDDGPVMPVLDPTPLPPSLTFPPMPVSPHRLPVSPIAGLDWSMQSWNEFLSGAGSMSIY